MFYSYTAKIYEGEGIFYASVPDIPGCVTTGSTLSEAIDLITDALSGCLCVLEDENELIPAPTAQSSLPHDAEDIYTLIRVDTLAYRAHVEH